MASFLSVPTRLQDHHRRTRKTVDTRTRHALKKDKFAQAAASSASWVGEHQAAAVRWSDWHWNRCGSGRRRSDLLECALVGRRRCAGLGPGCVHDAAGRSGSSAGAGVYTTAADRAKEANREFVAVAHDFGWLPEDRKPTILPALPTKNWGRMARLKPN